MDTVLVSGTADPLAGGSLPCAARLPEPVPAAWRDGRLEVDENLPERLRAALTNLGADEGRPAGIVLAPTKGVDPLGADAYLQSVTFLPASAALEAGLGVALLTRGVAAKGFVPLFRRYPGRAVAHVALTIAELDGAGAASIEARLEGLARLADAGVATWLRLDPAVPDRGDGPDTLERWVVGAAAAGATGVVVSPLVLTAEARQALGDDPGVVDYFRPGRRPRRGTPPPQPALHLPLEREAALVWRVRKVAEDVGLAVRLCRCARRAAASCGLAPVERWSARRRAQRRLFAG